MRLSSLRDRLRTQSQQVGVLTLDGAQLDVPALDKLTAALPSAAPLVIRGVAPGDLPDPTDRLVVSSADAVADLLGATEVPVTVEFVAVGDAIEVVLGVRMPRGWHLSDGFAALARHPFDAVRFDGETHLEFASASSEWSLRGALDLGGLPTLGATLGAVLDASQPLAVEGNLSAQAGVERSARLVATVGSAVSVGVAPAVLRVTDPAVVLSLDPPNTQSAISRSRVLIEGTLDGALRIALEMFQGSRAIAVTTAALPAGNDTSDVIAALPGGDAVLSRVPEALKEVFAEVGLAGFEVVIQGPTPRIGFMRLAVSTQRSWSVIPNVLELETLQLFTEITDPAGARRERVGISATAQFLPTVFAAPFVFDVELSHGRRWTVSRISGAFTGAVEMGRLVDAMAGEVPVPEALRALRLDAFEVIAEREDAADGYALQLVAAGDVPLPLGGRRWPARISLAMTRGVGGTTVHLAGGVVIADRTFALDLALGGAGASMTADLDAQANPLGFGDLTDALGLSLPALDPGASPALIAAHLTYDYNARALGLEATVLLPVPRELAPLFSAEPVRLTARFAGEAGRVELIGALTLTDPALTFDCRIALSRGADGARQRSLACTLQIGRLGLDLTFDETSGDGAARQVRCSATAVDTDSVADLLDRLGVELHAEVRDQLTDVAPPSIAVTMGGGVHLALAMGDIAVQLWRRGARWRSMIEVGGVSVPADLPVGPTFRALLRNARARWVPVSLTPDLPGIDRRIDRGLAVTTMLPFHETEIGVFLGGEDTFGVVNVPVALRPGAPEVRVDVALLPLMGVDQLEVFEGVEIHALDFRFVSPGQVGLRLGCDLTLPFGGEPTVRFVGQVEADLVDKEINFGVGLLGEVVDGTLDPKGWQTPFGFPGLTVGRLELMLGPGLRAFTGALTLGRASLQIDAVIEAGVDARTAIYVRGEHLTIQDLLDGFMAGSAPQLPGVIGDSGFRSLEVELLAAARNGPQPAPFTHTWPSGISKTWAPGFRATGTLTLYGLSFAALVDLDAGRFAGSMSRIDVGPLFLLEAPEGSEQTRPATWPAGVDWLGGPWMDFDAQAKRGDLHGRLVLFGIFSKQIDASLDGGRLEIVIEEKMQVRSIGGWTTRLTAEFAERNGGLDVALGGSLRLAVRFNPREILDDLIGVDIALLDLDLLDLVFEISVAGALRGTALSGRLDVAFELWGERMFFNIQLDTSLDAGTLAERALAELGTAALDVMALIGKVILKAVLAALEAIGEALEAVGEAILWALEKLAEALEWVGAAFTALGEALEEAGAEFASWLGFDGPKEDLQREKQADLDRARAAEAQRRAEVRQAQARRRVLMLDRLEHLADGGVASPSMNAQMQARIAAYADTLPWQWRVNPITEAPEFDPSGSRARYEHLWREALVRAERRQALRREFRAILEEARAELDGLGAQKDHAEDDAVAARAALADARARVAALRARLAGEVEQARRAAGGALLIAHEGAAKVETAFEESAWLVDLVRADDQALAEADARLTVVVEALNAPKAQADAAMADALTQLTTAGLVHALDVAESDLERAVAALAAALARIAAVEERMQEARLARDTLTLARLEALRLWRSVHLTAGDGFQAWRALCRQAGGAAQIRLQDVLLDDALALLAALPTQAAQSAQAGAELAVQAIVLDDDAPSAPTSLATVLAAPESEAGWWSFLAQPDAATAWINWPGPNTDAGIVSASDAVAHADAAWIRAAGRQSQAHLRLRANRAIEQRLRALDQAQRDAEALRQALLEAEVAHHASRQYLSFIKGIQPYAAALAAGEVELGKAVIAWTSAGNRAYGETRNIYNQLRQAASIDRGIRSQRGAVMSRTDNLRNQLGRSRNEVYSALRGIGEIVGRIRSAHQGAPGIPGAVTGADLATARRAQQTAAQVRDQLRRRANTAAHAAQQAQSQFHRAAGALRNVENAARRLGDMPKQMGRVRWQGSFNPLANAIAIVIGSATGAFDHQQINRVRGMRRPQLPNIGRPPAGRGELGRIDADFAARRRTLAEQRKPLTAIVPDARSRQRAEAEAQAADAAEQAARTERDARRAVLTQALDAWRAGREAVDASLPGLLRRIDGGVPFGQMLLQRTQGRGRATALVRQRDAINALPQAAGVISTAGASVAIPQDLDAAQLRRLIGWSEVLEGHGQAARTVRDEAESGLGEWPSTLTAHADGWRTALLQGLLSAQARELAALRLATDEVTTRRSSMQARVAADRQAIGDALQTIATLTTSAREALKNQRAVLDEAVRQYSDQSVGDTIVLVNRVDALDHALDALGHTIDSALRFTRQFTPEHRATIAADLAVLPATTDLSAIERAVDAARRSRDEVRRLADAVAAQIARIVAVVTEVSLGADGGAWAQDRRTLDAELDGLLADYRAVATTAEGLSDALRQILAQVAELITRAETAHGQVTDARAELARSEARLIPLQAQLSATADRVARLSADPHAARSVAPAPAASTAIAPALTALRVASARRRDLAHRLADDLMVRRARLAVSDPAYAQAVRQAMYAYQRQGTATALAADASAAATPTDDGRWVLEVHDPQGNSGLLAVALSADGSVQVGDDIGPGSPFRVAQTIDADGAMRVAIRSAFNGNALTLDGWPQCAPENEREAAAASEARRSAQVIRDTEGRQWLALRAAGPRLVRDDPDTIALTVRGAGSGTLIEWHTAGRRIRLVKLDGVLLIVGGASTLSSAPVYIGTSRQVVTIRRGDAGAWQVTASRGQRGRAVGGRTRLSRVVARWGDVEHVATLRGRRSTVGPAPDHALEATMTGLNAPLIVGPQRLGDGFGAALWVGPAAQTTEAVLMRLGTPGDAIWTVSMIGGATPGARRLQVRSSGADPLPAITLAPHTWHHLGLVARPIGTALEVALRLDGQRVIHWTMPSEGPPASLKVPASAAASIVSPVVWTHPPAEADLDRHLLHPGRRPSGQPAAWVGPAGPVEDGVQAQAGDWPVPFQTVGPRAHWLEAEQVGTRDGRPSVRLSMGQGRDRRYLAWHPDRGVWSTRNLDVAAEVSLRARLSDPLDPTQATLTPRIVGPEMPWTPPPVTGRLAAQQRAWEAALRRALQAQVAEREAWLTDRRAAADLARRHLQRAGFDLRLRRRDQAAWERAIDGLRLRADIGRSGLRFDGKGLARSPVLLLGAPDGPVSFSVSFWVRGIDAAPAGGVLSIIDAELPSARRMAGVRLTPVDDGVRVRVEAGPSGVDFEVPRFSGWRHLTIGWSRPEHRPDGEATTRVELRVDGQRARAQVLGVDLPLPGMARIELGAGFVGRVEQAAVWRGARAGRGLRREIAVGLGGLEPDLLHVFCPATNSVDGAPWQEAVRGGADLSRKTPALPPGVVIMPRHPLNAPSPTSRLAPVFRASDPVAALIAMAPSRLSHQPTVGDALRTLDVRPTREALGWSDALWRRALSSYDPDRLTGARARAAELRRVGIEPRPIRGEDAPGQLLAALQTAPTDRATTLDTWGWSSERLSEAELAALDPMLVEAAGLPSPAHAEAALRRMGLEPMYTALPDPLGARRRALTAAREALRLPTPQGLDAATTARWIQLEQVLLLPLLDQAGDSWFVEALRLGVLPDLEAAVLSMTPKTRAPWARLGAQAPGSRPNIGLRSQG